MHEAANSIKVAEIPAPFTHTIHNTLPVTQHLWPTGPETRKLQHWAARSLADVCHHAEQTERLGLVTPSLFGEYSPQCYVLKLLHLHTTVCLTTVKSFIQQKWASTTSHLRNGAEVENGLVSDARQVLDDVGHVTQRIHDQFIQARDGICSLLRLRQLQQCVCVLAPHLPNDTDQCCMTDTMHLGSS